MRYEDWDILLFPQNCKVPVKEFKVACHVVHDPESPHLGGTFGLPTVCCFVPSLPTGTPFRVSIHSWNAPAVSRFTNSYSKFPENIKFEARLFIDGRIVASTALDRESIWPHIVAHSFDFSKSGDLEPLSFPDFREELLQQNYWSPADDLGRIKLVLSEGFPRDSITTPFERVKNIVAFSFQHAPLEVLESSSIAWPNPSMWRSAPFAASMQVPTLQPDNFESHAHSPQRRGGNCDKLSHAMNSLQGAGTNSQFVPGGRRSTHPVYGPCLQPAPNGLDPFGNTSSYFEWLSCMDMGMSAAVGDNYFNNLTRSSVAQRSTRRTSTDVSMPDYVPVRSNSQCVEQQLAPDTFPVEDVRQNAQPKVPTNTPTADVQYKREAAAFPIPSNNRSLSCELADSLTNSLLNQPLSMSLQHSAFHAPATEVISRKEHRDQQHSGPSPTSAKDGPVDALEHKESRHVSQQLCIPLGSSIAIAKEDMTERSPNHSDHCVSALTRDNALPPGCPGHKPSSEVQEEEAKNGSVKGAKRMRNFTPASSRAMDQEDEARRLSPRVRLTSFLEGHATADTTP